MTDDSTPPRNPKSWSTETQSLRRARKRADAFAPTPLVLLERARHADPAATGALFRLYWQPIHGFLRRAGAREDEAGDVTQRYFERLIHSQDLENVDPSRRTFRSWLRTGAKRQLLNLRAEQRREHARAHEVALASMTSPAPPDAERLLRRQSVLDLLGLVWQRLGATYEAAGERRLFEHLRLTICEESSTTTDAELCQELGVSTHYVAMRRYRLRTKEFPKALAAQDDKRSLRELLDDLE